MSRNTYSCARESSGADTWEQLAVSGVPNAAGVLTLKVETFSAAADAKVRVDDISVTQEAGIAPSGARPYR